MGLSYHMGPRNHSGRQPWWQALLLTEASHQSFLIFNFSFEKAHAEDFISPSFPPSLHPSFSFILFCLSFLVLSVFLFLPPSLPSFFLFLFHCIPDQPQVLRPLEVVSRSEIVGKSHHTAFKRFLLSTGGPTRISCMLGQCPAIQPHPQPLE